MSLTAKQLAELATGLGGSDALTYANLDPRKSPVQLYADFVEGRRGKSDARLEEDPRIKWGKRLEPLVRDWLQEETGREIDSDLPTFRHRDPALSYMIGHLDGVMDAKETPAQGPAVEGVEIKTGDKFTAQDWGEVGTDEVPIRYVCQVMHYMAVSDIRQFHIAVLLGGNDPRHYVVQYDAELVSALTLKAKKFWTHVETRVPPNPTTLSDCDYRWPRSNEVVLRASDGMLEVLNMLDQLRREERIAARKADELEVSVKAYMGNVAVLTAPHRPQPLATWRTQERRYVDIAAMEHDHPDLVAQYRRVNSHRVFRLK